MTAYVLDTDHLSLYERAHPQVCDRIIEVRRHSSDSLAITIVSVEEQFAGRLAQVRKAATTSALIEAYGRLKTTLVLFQDLQVLDYDFKADEIFRERRKAGVRIGTLDLRIASITLAHGGILLTRNLQDFERVPELSLQDWST